MDWKLLSKADAGQITGQWNQMSADKFNELILNWDAKISSGLNEDYRLLREDILLAKQKINDKVDTSEEYKTKKGYYMDLFLAKELYQILQKYDFSLRMASNDQVWIYLCIKVFPDLVYSRYPGTDKKDSDGTIIHLNINEERFWKTKRRIYLKVLWWYIYLSLQKNENGKEDLDETVKILMSNSTDEIVQLVERSGTAGYRVDVYRSLMRYYADHRDRYDNRVFRKVMVLNTARTRIVEPDLLEGGVETYVKELFDYFE